jgi:predicted DNA-binding transcriptional regulator AlpA
MTISTAESRRFRPAKAAEYLGISASTLAKWRMRGDPPAYLKLGKVVVYNQADLDRWLEACRRQSTSQVEPISARSEQNQNEQNGTGLDAPADPRPCGPEPRREPAQ